MNLPQEYDRMSLVEMRERVVEQLQLNFAHDNVTEEELEDRLSRAHEAVVKKDLAAIIADLPYFDPGRSEISSRSDSPVRINTGEVRESAALVAVLGGSDRKGVWRPARRTNSFVLMGGVDLDFREAEMPPGVTEINIFAMMGGVDIVVPPGMNVEVQGIPILGGIDNRAQDTGGGGPRLKVRALVIMGGVDVKVKEPRKR